MKHTLMSGISKRFCLPTSEFVGAEAQPTQGDEVADLELLNSAVSFLHFQEAELSTPDDPAARTVYDLNFLGAFAVKRRWEHVRERILTLAGSDETCLSQKCCGFSMSL
jgi:hypothetical protein